MHAYSTIRESKLRAMLFSAAIMVGASTAANADTNIKVVTSVKPVHSLVASVMAGVGEPRLIVKGASTPHSYSLKPSQAKAIQEADVVFWIGHEMEAFLEDPIKTIGKRARVVELLDAHGVIKLKLREGGTFEAHDHDDDHEHAK